MPRPPPRHRPTNPTGRLHELGYRGPPARAHHRSDRPQRLPRTPPRPHVLLLLHRQPERLNTDPLKTEPQLTSRCSDPLRPPSLPTRLARHGDTPVAAVPEDVLKHRRGIAASLGVFGTFQVCSGVHRGARVLDVAQAGQRRRAPAHTCSGKLARAIAVAIGSPWSPSPTQPTAGRPAPVLPVPSAGVSVTITSPLFDGGVRVPVAP